MGQLQWEMVAAGQKFTSPCLDVEKDVEIQFSCVKYECTFSPYLSFLSVDGHSGKDDQVYQVKQEIQPE